jgi:hypothetical protein
MSILDSVKYVTIMTDQSADVECRIIIPVGQSDYFIPTNENSICKALMAPQIMPCLIEKIKDTTFVKVMFEGVFNYTISDVVIEFIIYILSGKFDFADLFFREFDRKDMSDNFFSITGYKKMALHNHIFIGDNPEENYKNRIKFYNAMKKSYERGRIPKK